MINTDLFNIEEENFIKLQIPNIVLQNLPLICQTFMVACRNQITRLQLVKTILDSVLIFNIGLFRSIYPLTVSI